ncbi:MAG: hypothetical protein ABMA64_06240 [Myxococcota bacterium]
MVWVAVWGGVVFAQEQDCDADHGLPPATWAAADDGVLEITSEVEPGGGVTVQIQAEATLADLHFSWVQEPVSVPDGFVALRVDAPAEAYLDALALDYVTVLHLRLEVLRDGQLVGYIPVPASFLAWPLGASFAPVVWDEVSQGKDAPNGLLSDKVRAAFGDALSPDAWASPPRFSADAKRE